MEPQRTYRVKAVLEDDIPTWLALSHEYDRYTQHLIADISIFYRGFDTYMMRKIQQHEAFMSTENMAHTICCGIIAFSITANRITFLGVFERYHGDFERIGTILIQHALSQLDRSQAITTTVLKCNAGIFLKEKQVFEDIGFVEQEGTLMEAGIPACLLRLSPM